MKRFLLFLVPFLLLFLLNTYWLISGSGSGKGFPSNELLALIPYAVFLFTFASIVFLFKRVLYTKKT